MRSPREVPLWNRFNGTGRALWGQGQTFFGDPLHWLTFLDADWGQDLKFVAHRFVFAAGVGLVAFTGGLQLADGRDGSDFDAVSRLLHLSLQP